MAETDCRGIHVADNADIRFKRIFPPECWRTSETESPSGGVKPCALRSSTDNLLLRAAFEAPPDGWNQKVCYLMLMHFYLEFNDS